MDASEHGPATVELSADGSFVQWMECRCGSICHLGSGWKIIARDRHIDGNSVILEPSINFAGHFHTPNPTGPLRIGLVGERNSEG